MNCFSSMDNQSVHLEFPHLTYFIASFQNMSCKHGRVNTFYIRQIKSVYMQLNKPVGEKDDIEMESHCKEKITQVPQKPHDEEHSGRINTHILFQATDLDTKCQQRGSCESQNDENKVLDKTHVTRL